VLEFAPFFDAARFAAGGRLASAGRAASVRRKSPPAWLLIRGNNASTGTSTTSGGHGRRSYHGRNRQNDTNYELRPNRVKS